MGVLLLKPESQPTTPTQSPHCSPNHPPASSRLLSLVAQQHKANLSLEALPEEFLQTPKPPPTTHTQSTHCSPDHPSAIVLLPLTRTTLHELEPNRRHHPQNRRLRHAHAADDEFRNGDIPSVGPTHQPEERCKYGAGTGTESRHCRCSTQERRLPAAAQSEVVGERYASDGHCQ